MQRNSTKIEYTIRPILRGRDIKRYGYEFADLWLITTFPSLKIEIENYPAVKQHLLSYDYNRLKQTGEVGARKKTNNKWFETQDSISYWEDFYKQKIVWAEMTNQNAFVWDDTGVLTNQTCYFIPTTRKYLLGILNSTTTYFYFSNFAASLGDGAFRWIKQYVEQIPIPKVSDEVEQKIELLIDQIIKNKNKDTVTLEKEVDNIIYELFELTEEEIGYIARLYS